MLEHIKRVLDNAGVTPEDAAALAPLVATPPAGTFDAAELGAANEAQVALPAAIVAAGRTQHFGTTLQRLLECADAAQTSLSDYDRGRFWHLKGVAAWRLDDTQDVVILFSDIRDFTHISEGFAAEPGALITFLNDYLGHMTLCVERCHGMVDKFIGDAVMAVFSLPVPHPDTDAERAVLAALMMRDELERFNRKLPPGTPHLATGIGLHTGPVVAGLIGSPQKRSYTVIGDAVNTASRLESLAKHLGASIMISDEVAGRLPNPDRFLLRPLGSYRLKGKDTPVVIADVMGEDDGSSFVRPLKEEIARVGEALQRLRARDFTAATKDLTALAARVGPATRASGYRFLADTARAYSAQPPDAWDGVIEMVDK